VRLVSHRLRDAGYFTANVTEVAPGLKVPGKTDFNFQVDGKAFDGTHWNQRAKGQPFYAQVNLTAPHKGAEWPAARRGNKSLIDPAKVELPPYYPDHPVVRDEVANYLDAVERWDAQVGVILDALRADGLLDNTVIFVFGDNGRCLLRGKQWLYDAGTHVPLLVRWPGRVARGTLRRDLVSALDITATALDIAGVAHPRGMHGQGLFGGAKPRQYIFTARDRCDMTVDRIRAVRDQRYKLIHNFMPERPYAQFNEYIRDNYPTLRILQELHAAAKLNATQSQWMAPRKPEFELYDLKADPHEVRNLAEDPAHRTILRRLSGALDRWIDETGDQGRTPESPETIRREEPRA
jgi:arylsulfatase A-like enzyme